MTRANLNFIGRNPGKTPRVLFHYRNGDQYPEGLLQYFGIEVFLTIDRLWTPDDFHTWIRGNYREVCRKITRLPNGRAIDLQVESETPAEPEDLGEDGQPKIFYTGTFITDFSYVFTHGLKLGRKRKDGSSRDQEVNWVMAWKWNELIFDGPALKFLTFCQKRVKQEIIPGDVATTAAMLGVFDRCKFLSYFSLPFFVMKSYSTRPALEERTLQFAANVRAFAKRLPHVIDIGDDVQQLLRAAAGVGACYIEANEAPTKTEFVARIRMCLKEAKEAIFWLRLTDTGASDSLTEFKDALIKESRELIQIYFAILRKLR